MVNRNGSQKFLVNIELKMDREAEAAYLTVGEATTDIITEPFNEYIFVDYNNDGSIVGFETLYPIEGFPAEELAGDDDALEQILNIASQCLKDTFSTVNPLDVSPIVINDDGSLVSEFSNVNNR